jgi:hypothetical protein
MLDIFQEAIKAFPRGSKLPGTGYTVKGFGKTRGQDAIVYLIPNRADPKNPYQKRFAASELRRAYDQLSNSGQFTRVWFSSEMRECAKVGPCNFLAMGAIFVGLNLAHKERGIFTLRGPLQEPTPHPARAGW